MWLLVLDREAPDVPAHTPLEVEAAEHQGRLADVEVGQAALGDVPGDVALEPGLVGAAGAHVGVGGPDPFGRGSHGLEPRVRRRDIGLFGGQLRVHLVLQIAPHTSVERDFRMGQPSRSGTSPRPGQSGAPAYQRADAGPPKAGSRLGAMAMPTRACISRPTPAPTGCSRRSRSP